MSRMWEQERRGGWHPTPAGRAGVMGLVAVIALLTFAGLSGAATRAAAPTLSRLTPASGTASGGSRLTLTGSGFTKVRRVTFGGAGGSHLRVISAHKLTVLTPRHAAGRVAVVVVSAHGSSRVHGADHFSYRAPAAVGGTITLLTGTGVQSPAVQGPALSSGVGEPAGLAVNPSTGSVYVADTDNNLVTQVAGGQLSFFAGQQPGIAGPAVAGPATGTSLDMPQGVAYDTANGDVYIADSQTNEILQVTPAGALTVIAGGGRSLPTFTPQSATNVILGDPTGVTVDPADGNLFIADRDDNDVEEITPTGQLSIVAGELNQDGAVTNGSVTGPTQATQVALDNPQGVSVDPANGDVYIADTFDQEVDRITPAGGLAIIAGGGSDQLPNQTPTPARDFRLSAPGGVAYDSANGDLYIADSADGHIDQVTPAGKLTLVAGATNATQALKTGANALQVGLNGPLGVAVNPATGVLYVADTENNVVESITPRR